MTLGPCPYPCTNKNDFGYCKTTACINYKYQQILEVTDGLYSHMSPCWNCPNNPRNGGSGICHCILGSPKIT